MRFTPIHSQTPILICAPILTLTLIIILTLTQHIDTQENVIFVYFDTSFVLYVDFYVCSLGIQEVIVTNVKFIRYPPSVVGNMQSPRC